MTEYPRVLHLGHHPIGVPTNSGITLRTMFADWPAESLLQVCLREHPAFPTPANAIIAPPSIAPVDGLARRLLGRRVPTGAIDGLNNSIERPKGGGFTKRLRVLATAANDVGPVWLPPDLMRSIESFRPQVVHSLLGGVRAMRLANAVARRLDLPILAHFMDDWPDNLFMHGQLGGLARREVDRSLRRTLRRSPLLLTIGYDMKREFEERYSRPCVVVGNSAEFGGVEGARPAARDDRRQVLRYVGSLHLGRDQVVRRLAEIIDRTSLDWRIEIFTPSSEAALGDRLSADFSCVERLEPVPPEEVPRALREADALLFLESAEPAVARFTRLSVSTKVPEYLASARPVLVMGPEDQGSVRALRRAPQAVYLADDLQASDLAAALRTLAETARTGPAEPADWMIEEFGSRATRARLLDATRQAILSAGSDPR